MIDFREIISPEVFVDLVAEILRREEGVLSVTQGGRGTDYEVDILFRMQVRCQVVSLDRTLVGIVQCKHFARSNKAVSKGQIQPADALRAHQADAYLLVTSTRVGSFYSKVIEGIREDRRQFQSAACWDCSTLEQKLLKRENRDLLERFLPKNAQKLLRESAECEKAFAAVQRESLKNLSMPNLVTPSNGEDFKTMHKAYLITGLMSKQPLAMGALHQIARRLGVSIESSGDTSLESILSVDSLQKEESRLGKAEAVFAVITRESRTEPNIWIEVERASAQGNLQAVFIDENVFRLGPMGQYPCVVLRHNFEQTFAEFVKFFRGVFQKLGDDAHRWFWFGIAILTVHFKVSGEPSVASMQKLVNA